MCRQFFFYKSCYGALFFTSRSRHGVSATKGKSQMRYFVLDFFSFVVSSESVCSHDINDDHLLTARVHSNFSLSRSLQTNDSMRKCTWKLKEKKVDKFWTFADLICGTQEEKNLWAIFIHYNLYSINAYVWCFSRLSFYKNKKNQLKSRLTKRNKSINLSTLHWDSNPLIFQYYNYS